MKNIISCLLVCLLLSLAGSAQQYDYNSFKEKIYLHTSHVFFQPGEELFFKLYVVNAKDQTPAKLSKVAYVEVIDPSGKVLAKQNYEVNDGYAEGSYAFMPDAPGGSYKLKAYTTWMRNEADSTFFVKELTLQKVIPPRVLMKLDFPQKGYGPGDEVTADYAIRNLSDQPVAGYKINYKISIGGTVIQSSVATTGKDGKVQLRFTLPSDLNTTDGLLNVTIDYDAYTEAISRSIPIVLNKIDLQLLPEGGTLVAGLNSNIAFRAVNEHGKPVDVKGVVLDHAGNKVAAFDSYYGGMGKFRFTPQSGEKYSVKITSPLNISQTYSFPTFTDDGLVMNLNAREGQLLMDISSKNARRVTLLGQTKSVSFYTKTLDLKAGTQTITIDTSIFPAGIARFTLVAMDQQPIAERLVFLNKSNVLQVSVTTDKSQYLPREKVVMTVKTTDRQGQPLPANLSLSVMDDKLWSFADDKQDHILSWLLMSSELHGKIEEPSFYFRRDEPKADPALDLVMLTHGYRYFSYIPGTAGGDSLKYFPDEGRVLSGVVVNRKNEPVRATVFLINVQDRGRATQMTTDPDGAFFFAHLDAYSHYYLIARSRKSREQVSIRIEQNGVEFNGIRSRKLQEKIIPFRQAVYPLPIIPQKKGDANAVRDIVKMDNTLGSDKALSEVVVVAYGAQKKANLTGAVTTVTGKDLENIPVLNIPMLLQGRVGGLVVTPVANPGAQPNLRIRGNASVTGNNEPLYVIDGIPMDRFDPNLNPNDIEHIEVLKSMQATALYGARAANGVIAVTTKRKKAASLQLKLNGKSYYATASVAGGIPNFAASRRFYAPRYATTETKERNDFRETIYWNPTVQTGNTGTATLEFYNSDAATTFRAIAEGIAWNGKPGRTEATWSTRSALQIDARIPPYLSVGDRALIPLVLKNNGTSGLELDISLTLPENMSAGKFENTITVAANSARQVLVPLEAIAPTSGIVKFTVNGNAGSETLALPVTVAERGFPVIYIFSGDKSAEHSFIVNQPVKGSIRTKLQVFSTLEGQLLDGIESMLREPYGCFEQTSSSTYPNILILKYLKETGRSNREVEQRAMNYIQTGYKKLIGFETSDRGFEWFGKTPPHEALTAYGLLEFTDMKDFIDVDKGMLARTKAFLLSRRDGQGGFKLSSTGYDKFASVPNHIANLYIVYALTQAGIGAEIQKEYEAGVQKALASKDAYQMGLMSLAASNVKNTADYNRLMTALKESYQRKELILSTSVVNSRDASLRVEALSLYTMALAREAVPDKAAMAKCISEILSAKTYYGYGATQATVLALQAIIDYTKLKGKFSKEDIAFQLNNMTIEKGSGAEKAVKSGANNFSVTYRSAEAEVPYSMEVAYYTMQPASNPEAVLQLATTLSDTRTKTGETVRMNIQVKNMASALQPMSIAKIGIPAGLSLQPWQLKELTQKNEVAYYEIFDNYLVLYWMGFSPGETKTIHLDLKADVPGKYKGKASNCYLYYTPEHKHWQEGTAIEILP
ncbi:TonB-dependent receptor plug domain-containing protein [Chitinophaga arvensicola]|uniref:TonB-dependent outer membrane receptor, SusC/RagA subfamily, signature region n=1 Tax=Chitinophaga arvensicola TaxID=29529 RepID=A0A1I0S566_9BACT|nr:TonB-dependent receptor plug domain-containing protein [Chitinophaga arvensicola]SEW50046.1 TonB-dependent outer membrane receptor, SusC/RagA subfamily, signature region [Chitinophaga arvensicola]